MFSLYGGFLFIGIGIGKETHFKGGHEALT